MDMRVSRIDAGSLRPLKRGALPAVMLALLCTADLPAASPGSTAPAAAPSASDATMLPLLPPRRRAEQQALRAAVAAHPELLRPEPAGMHAAAVALALYPDGRMAASNLRFAEPPMSPGGLLVAASPQRRAMLEWLQSLLPGDGEAPATAEWARGTAVGNGRLGADVTLYFARVPDNFDPRRSDARVRSIVSRLHRDLLFTGDDTRNRLTVLLDGDGALIARHIDRIPRVQATQAGPQVPVAQRAQALASRLQVDMAQIGLMGRTRVQDGGELYVVEYAWQREAGGSAPQVLQPLPPAEAIDSAVAQALVARHFPAASTPSTAAGSAGSVAPAIVLSMDGEVLRTGSVPLVNGGLPVAALQQPLLQQLRIADVLVQALPGTGGRMRDALFVWYAGEPPTGPAPEAAAPADGRTAPRPAAWPVQATASQPPRAARGDAMAAADVPQQALQSLLRAHPDILDSANRGGWYSGAVLLRADGSLFRSALRFAPDRAQAMRDILDQRYIPDSATAGFASATARAKREPQLLLKRPGDGVGAGRTLQNHLVVQYAVLPADHDEQRTPLKVWESVAARHAALLLPRDAPVANRVTVLLAEDGSIAREYVEVGTPEQMRTAAADFAALGLAAGDIGVRGEMTLGRNDYQEVDAAPDDQQMLRAALWSALGKRDELIVHYAWPRRPGEAAAAYPAASGRRGAANFAADGTGVSGLRAIAAEALAADGDTD